MNRTRSARIGIVESNRLSREYLEERISGERQMGLAFANASFTDACESGAADVVLAAWECIRAIPQSRRRTLGINQRLLIMRADSCPDIMQCIQSGATGFTLTDSPFEDIARAIRIVLKGGWAIPTAIAETLFGQLAGQSVGSALSFGTRITNRERQIIELIRGGLTNKEIAAMLSISVLTVKTHVHNITDKLNCRNRVDIIVRSWGVQLGVADAKSTVHPIS